MVVLSYAILTDRCSLSSKVQMRDKQLIRQLREEFQPKRLLPNLTMGLVATIIDAIYAISFAALIFSGVLSPYASTGIGLALLSVAITSIVIALTSSLSGMLTSLQEGPTAIVALTASLIVTQMPASASVSETLFTVMAAIVLINILTGIFCFVFGRLKLGNLPRFIPYPVVGGFLAGTGWLLAQGAISLMTDFPLDLAHLPQLFQPNHLIQWLPGLGFAILVLLVLRRYSHALITPGLILGAIALFYLILAVTHTSIATARTSGLFLDPFPEGGLWQPLPLAGFWQTDWQAIAAQTGKILTVPLITVLAVLLKSTGIELATKQDLDLNRELQAAGVANLVSGLSGGLIIGFQSLSLSTLSYAKVGIKSRMVGLFKALLCIMLLFAGGAIISYFPKPVLGGMLLFLGLDYLVEWLYDAWFKLPKLDYLMVALILVVIGAVGFLEGVAVGLVVAIVLFVINYSQVNVTKHILSGATYPSHAARSWQQRRLLQTEGNQIYILELQGFLFFGTANKLVEQIRLRLRQMPPVKSVVLSFQAVTGLDSSSVLSFSKLQQVAQQQQFNLIFTHVSPTIQRQLQQGGCLQDPFCQLFPDLDRGIEWCENQILEEIPQRRRRALPLALQLDDLFPNVDHVPTFMNYLEELVVEAGQALFQAGDAADALYLIETGEVTVWLELGSGQMRRLQSLGAGNLVGETEFFLQAPHQTSAITNQPSTLYCLSQAALQRLQQDHLEVAATFQKFVIRVVSDRLSSTYKEVTDLLK
ncbi:MAG: SLC26A/SulP transporter family protein [Oscillatoriophycideae cyanobacterium NC_groundwater_1537_Pr4_S-0.65um_50_18]|nr:SLC26A/SulP transporter family protein [Oscillatoriophycideae cyanobacterium NC_groundwater_1537_Pr4_S-0.65um_50_18]